MTKVARVYGLPRSGTNYVEYLVRNYTQLRYENEFAENAYLGYRTAVKHCPPEPGADITILVFKQEKNFIDSFTRWDGETGEINPSWLWSRMIVDYCKFAQENRSSCLVVSWERCLGNEHKLIREVAWRTKAETVQDDIQVPDKSFDRDGGVSVTEIPFQAPSDLSVYPNPLNRYLCF